MRADSPKGKTLIIDKIVVVWTAWILTQLPAAKAKAHRKVHIIQGGRITTHYLPGTMKNSRFERILFPVDFGLFVFYGRRGQHLRSFPPLGLAAQVSEFVSPRRRAVHSC